MRMPKHIALAATLAAAPALATPALAQQAAGDGTAPDDTAPPAYEIRDLRSLEDIRVPRLGISVGRLEHMDIIGPDGEEIAEVDEILIDRSGNVVAVVAEYDRFLGLGDREVVMDLRHLALQDDRDDLVTTMTQEELESLPEWDD